MASIEVCLCLSLSVFTVSCSLSLFLFPQAKMEEFFLPVDVGGNAFEMIEAYAQVIPCSFIVLDPSFPDLKSLLHARSLFEIT